MGIELTWLRVAALMLGTCIGILSMGAVAQTADPAVWGPYARVVGTQWKTSGDVAEWKWGPDNSIVETHSFMMKSVIRQGAGPGELVYVYGPGLHTYDGRIAPDGSVLWIRRGRFLKMPHRVSLVGGRFIEELVKLDEVNQVVKVSSTTEFVQTAGPQVSLDATLASATRSPSNAASASSSALPVAAQADRSVPMNVASAAAATAPAQPVVRPSFGQMDAFIGQVLVGEAGNLIVTTSEDGQVLNLTGSRDSLSVRHSGTPGQLTVLSHSYDSRATASLQPNGELVVMAKGSALSGSHERLTFSATDEGGISRYSESKPRALLSAMLSWEYDSQYTFRPNSEENARLAASEKRYSQQQAAENRQAELEDKAALDQAYNRMVGDLSDHAAREMQIQAEADDTVARINAQAEAIRQARIYEEQQAEVRAAEERRLQLEKNARTVAEKERAAASLQSAPSRAADTQAQVAERATRPQPQDRETQAAERAAPAASRPLRFVMSITLLNKPGDKVNPSCYSNIISRPGPPGWGVPGFLPSGSAEQARAQVFELKSTFIAQCRASGREITSEGNFNFQLNQTTGDDERMLEWRARYAEDVSVSL